MGPTEYIVIQNCVYQTKDDARFRGNCLMAMGSEMSGGINQVYVEDCTVIGNLAGKVFNRKTNPARGGYIMNVYTRNIDWSQVTGKRRFYGRGVWYRGLEYKKGDPELWPPVFHNININE